MNVLLVLGTSEGGVGRHVRALVTAGREAGHVVAVAGPATTLARHGLTGAAVEIDDTRQALGAVTRLRGVVARADLVHAHGLRATALASLANPARLLSTWHNPPPTGRLGAVVAARAARGPALVLCVSADLVAAVEQRGGRGALAPIGAERLPAAVQHERLLPLGAVLTVARLHPQKGLDVLAQVAAARPRIPFVVVGDGPLKSSLWGHELHVWGARDDVPALLREARVFVLPSRWEGSPLALHEALQAGVPCVATAVGGVPDLVGKGALLVPPDDAAALAAAVDRVYGDEVLRRRLVMAGHRALESWPDAKTAAARAIAVWSELA